MTQDQVKLEWGKLLAELYAAVSGEEPHPRSTPSILRDLERTRLDPAAKGLGLQRPCDWLTEYTAFDREGSYTKIENEHYRWVKLGWLSATTKEEDRRRSMDAAAEVAREEYNASLKKKWAAQDAEYAAANRPITLAALGLVSVS